MFFLNQWNGAWSDNIYSWLYRFVQSVSWNSYNRVLIIDLINYIPLFINVNDFLLTQ